MDAIERAIIIRKLQQIIDLEEREQMAVKKTLVKLSKQKLGVIMQDFIDVMKIHDIDELKKFMDKRQLDRQTIIMFFRFGYINAMEAIIETEKQTAQNN